MIARTKDMIPTRKRISKHIAWLTVKNIAYMLKKILREARSGFRDTPHQNKSSCTEDYMKLTSDIRFFEFIDKVARRLGFTIIYSLNQDSDCYGSCNKQHKTITIYTNKLKSTNEFYCTILHELGHATGAYDAVRLEYKPRYYKLNGKTWDDAYINCSEEAIARHIEYLGCVKFGLKYDVTRLHPLPFGTICTRRWEEARTRAEYLIFGKGINSLKKKATKRLINKKGKQRENT